MNHSEKSNARMRPKHCAFRFWARQRRIQVGGIMSKVMQGIQFITWLLVAMYFAILISEHINFKPAKNDIVAQLEQQVNYELE